MFGQMDGDNVGKVDFLKKINEVFGFESFKRCKKCNNVESCDFL